jgi:hypothetical protein
MNASQGNLYTPLKREVKERYMLQTGGLKNELVNRVKGKDLQVLKQISPAHRYISQPHQVLPGHGA